MNDDLKYTFKPAPGEKLTDVERAQMREHLARHMALNPLPAGAAASARSWRSEVSWSFYLARAGAFAALVLVMGGGISYAAQGAVPGDLLYLVKRSVNESVEGALALSTSAKASWSAELASRRLAEAETLASRGSLDSAVAAQLSTEAQSNAQAAAERIAALGESDPEEAAVAAVKLTASLSAHGTILSLLGEEESAAQIGAALGTKGGTLEASQAKTAPAPAQALSSAPSGSNAGISASSSGRVNIFKKAALEVRERAAAALEKAKASLSAEDLAKATVVLAEVDASLAAAAEAEIESDAFGHYKEALRKAQSLSVLLKAASSFKLRAFLNDEKRPASATAATATSTTSAEEGSGQNSETNGGAGAASGASAGAEATASATSTSEVERSGERDTIERILAPFLR